MIKDITLGQFFPGDSVIHKLDPRIKVVLTLFFIVNIFVSQRFESLLLTIVMLAVILLLSRIHLRIIYRSVKPVLLVILLTAILNIFYVKGDVLFTFWIIEVTRQGVRTAIFMAIRILCLVVGSSVLTYTTSPTALTDAMERLMSPLKIFKIEVHSIAMMMTIALRFIPTLIEEIDKISNAQKARGADMDTGGLLRRVKALIPILIPLFVSAFRRAYELAFAMECRCYRGGEGRTHMKQMKTKRRDLFACLAMVLMLGGILLCNTYGIL